VSETQDAIDEQRRSARVHAIRDRVHLVYLADQDDVSNHHRRVRRRHRPIHDVDDRVNDRSGVLRVESACHRTNRAPQMM